MQNDFFIAILILICFIGSLVALIFGIQSYKKTSRTRQDKYLLEPLINTDSSIEKAVVFLKITNNENESNEEILNE